MGYFVGIPTKQTLNLYLRTQKNARLKTSRWSAAFANGSVYNQDCTKNPSSPLRYPGEFTTNSFWRRDVHWNILNFLLRLLLLICVLFGTPVAFLSHYGITLFEQIVDLIRGEVWYPLTTREKLTIAAYTQKNPIYSLVSRRSQGWRAFAPSARTREVPKCSIFQRLLSRTASFWEYALVLLTLPK